MKNAMEGMMFEKNQMLNYLRQAKRLANHATISSNKVDKKSGTWRLWYEPLAMTRASERLKPNLPKVKRELIPGRNLKMEVDESQFERTNDDDDTRMTVNPDCRFARAGPHSGSVGSVT